MSVGGGRGDAHVSEQEFCDYVRNRRPVLLGIAIGLTGNRADAEDLMQAALAKTYLAWDKISDRAALDGYVRRAMVNTHISWWRRRRLEEYPTDEMPDIAVGDHAADSDLREVVVRALNRLPSRMRAAVMLRYLEDKTEPEIADTLGISLGTVKSTVSRAMAKLREDVELSGLRPCPFRATIDGRIIATRRWPVRSTMMEYPLTVASIMRVGTSVFGGKGVTTATSSGVRHRDYRTVGSRAARLANALRSIGVDDDQRVGTLMWNNAEHLEAYLAIPSMGAVLHTLNLRLPPQQIGYIATHAEDHAIICDESLVSLLASVLPFASTVKHVLVVGSASEDLPGVTVHSYEDLLASSSDVFSWPALDERSAAAMCYTSGTTGNPKGVVYSHRSTYLHTLGLCTGNAFGIAESDRVLPVVPMFHANAWGLPYAALYAGADLVMPDRFMKPSALVALVGSSGATIAGGVPTIWAGVLEEMRAGSLSSLSSLRMCIGGGSAVPHALISAYSSELGVELVQAWGMTETSPLGSVAWPPSASSSPWSYRDSGGRLLATLEGRITGDDGVVLPSDGEAVGELEVRGPWVTASYYRDPAPEKFHDGWLRTGDVGSLDELGYVRLTDRAKDVIKSGGEWISSMELENHLMAHPSVLEAGVIGIPDSRWGERPLAAVVLRSAVSCGELRAFLADRVARWQIPEYWAFIDQVPRTSVGKFNKRAMRDAYAAGDYEVIEAR